MSILMDVFEWAVSAPVTGMLQWIGTAIALIGLPLTYIKAKKAAKEATLAAHAVARFQHRIVSLTISHSYSHLESLKGFVNENNYDAANAILSILNRTVLQTANWLDQADDAPKSISQGRRNINRIQAQLSLAARQDTSFDPTKLDKAIRGLGECLVEWEGWIVSTSTEVK